MVDHLKIDVQALEQHIAALIAEYPELAEDEQLRADMLEGESDIDAVLKRALETIATATEVLVGIKERSDELKKRKDRYERRIEALKALVFRVMRAANLAKRELPEATISIAKGVDSVVVDDPNALPQGYVRTKTEPDKAAIKASLKAGEDIPGARLVTGEPSLRIARS